MAQQGQGVQQTPGGTWEQQILSELSNTRAQLQQMATAHDALAAAHEALRAASEKALNEKTAQIAETESKLGKLAFQQKFDLLDFKTLQPEIFKGRHHETFKPWARKVKAFCNAKQQGFRKALDWAEKQEHEIHDISSMGWDRAAAANEKLHDFLLQLCAEGAQVLVDTPALEGRGFEALATSHEEVRANRRAVRA